MRRIMIFCIPAFGHHNPTLPVAAELVRRGNAVRYYSFAPFREKILETGAEFVPCDAFLPELTEEETGKLRKVSTTEMTVTDLKTTARMDAFLAEEVKNFCPDVIFTDSVCFWGKLTARKYKIPVVVSTTTFAFNRFSSQYMKNSFAEIADVLGGSGRVRRELKKLEQYGYHEKSIMPLVQNDNFTDTVVYATKAYQPCSHTFSKHYAFVGPSIDCNAEIRKEHARPLVYISMGTVINERPLFYGNCIKALEKEAVDVVISCGQSVAPASLGSLPSNVQVFRSVDQPEVLSRANVFLTHCGMNSVSESLYMATPMVLFPQTNEQRAVARRARELGTGTELKDDSPEAIRKAIQEVLQNPAYRDAAEKCSRDFREAPGAAGAADFILSAPHEMPEEDKRVIRREFLPGVIQLLYWCAAVPLILFLGKRFGMWWLFAILANVLFAPFRKLTEKVGGMGADREK